MKALVKLFFAILIIIIGILLVVIFSQTNNLDQEEPILDNRTEQETSTDEPEPEPEPVSEFSLQLAGDWEYLDRATEAIQDLAPGQFIDSVLDDPTEENTTYFTASAYDRENEEILLSVYTYNTDDFTWERLFRGTYAEGSLGLDDEALPILRLAGYDDGELILLVQDADDSPGACSRPLLLGTSEQTRVLRRLVSMDIEEPYNGFTSYTPSEDTLAQEEQLQSGCLRDLE